MEVSMEGYMKRKFTRKLKRKDEMGKEVSKY